MNAGSGTGRAAVSLLLLLAACSSPGDPRESDDLTPDPPNALSITLTKAIWSWDEVVGPQGSGVRATLTNASDRTLASTLGDKFNAATEQADLFVALGGSGALEWRDPNGAWRAAGLAHLVEGTKPITLRPAGTYRLTALLREPRNVGTYRIRIDYFDAPLGAVRHTDYSAHFQIR